MKKFFSVSRKVAAVFVLLLCAVSCGGSDSKADSAAAAQKAEPKWALFFRTSAEELKKASNLDELNAVNNKVDKYDLRTKPTVNIDSIDMYNAAYNSYCDVYLSKFNELKK